MKKTLILCLFAFCFASAAKKSLAVMPCVGDFDAKELERLRNKVEEVTRDVLPSADFRMIPYKNVQEEIGDEALFNACKEGGVCFGDLAGKVNADYGAWCMVNKYGNKLTLTFQLYSVSEKDLIHTKEYDSYNPKNIDDMIEIIKTEVPIAIKEKIPGVKISKASPPAIAGGIGGVQISGSGYESDGGKRYLVNLSTEPAGAVLSFNGLPNSSCPKTPCKTELSDGSVRIIANLEQYEIADTTVSIKQNNQSINIKLKPNFGVLEIKPTYSDGIGNDKQWNLSINDKPYSLGEIRLSPNKYKVKLNHECYENIGFDVGINKGKREVFDMASKIALKKGGLDLSAERNGEPAIEPVFVNGKQVGETPFNGSVPLCAKIEIGKNKEVANVKLKANEKVTYTHKSTESQEGKYLTDSRDGKKYKVVEIGTQTWMAENLNYSGKNDDIGYCYEKNPKNCEKYGALYTWDEAMKACPAGWHLPSDKEWDILVNFAGGDTIAGRRLKAKSWNRPGCKFIKKETTSRGKVIETEYDNCAKDEFGFAALPIIRTGTGGLFFAQWWSASTTEFFKERAYMRGLNDVCDYSDSPLFAHCDYVDGSPLRPPSGGTGQEREAQRIRAGKAAYKGGGHTVKGGRVIDDDGDMLSVRCVKDYNEVVSVESSISVDSSKSVEFSKPNRLKFGIGGTIDKLSFRDNVNFDNPNIEATRLIGDAYSLGMVMNIPVANMITFNPEFYLVYRTITNDYECSTICHIEIKEYAIDIPLIASLKFVGEIDEGFSAGIYLEAGASLDIPLSTSVSSNPQISVDREKFNSSVVFGAGFILGDFYLGARGNIGITYFDKNAGGKYSSRIFIARYFF